MKTYEVRRKTDEQSSKVVATVNGKPLNPRTDLINHSPTGYEFGFSGSGPAQLALAILADFTGDDELACKLHQTFKQAFIARQTGAFTIEGAEIATWIGEQRARRNPDKVGEGESDSQSAPPSPKEEPCKSS